MNTLLQQLTGIKHEMAIIPEGIKQEQQEALNGYITKKEYVNALPEGAEEIIHELKLDTDNIENVLPVEETAALGIPDVLGVIDNKKQIEMILTLIMKTPVFRHQVNNIA